MTPFHDISHLPSLDDALWQDDEELLLLEAHTPEYDPEPVSAPSSPSSSCTSPFPWHAGLQVPEDIWSRSKLAVQYAEEALQALQQYSNPPPINEDELLAHIARLRLPLSSYLPGSCSLFLEGWKAFLAPLGPDKDAAQVLDILEHGYTLDLINPLDPHQVNAPGYDHRTSVLRRILLSAFGSSRSSYVDAILSSDSPTPPSVWLPNFKSAELHPQVVTDKLEKLLQCGTIAEWTPDMGTPHLVNSLGVVCKDGEFRLVMGPMVLNRWQKRFPFGYETVSLAEAFLQPGDYMFKDDAKAGYHHIPIHPDYWKYLVVYWNGKYYYFKFLPFGLASACHVYTQFQLVANRVLRLHGEEMLQYIDDALHTARTLPIARHHAYTRLLMGAALGIFFSDKSSFPPTQATSILGLDITTVATDPEFPGQHFVCFSIPQRRITKLKALATTLLTSASPTKRQLASVAGMLLSCKPAAPLSPLFVRSLYDTLRTAQDWDQSLTLTPAAIADLRWIIDSLDKFNGRKLKKPLRQHGLLIDVDSSDFSHAAKIFDLSSDTCLGDMVAQFPPHLHGTSSTLREASGISSLASQAFERYSPLLKHSYLRLHIRNDNQGAVSNFQHMKAGSLDLLQPVHDLYNLCMQHNVTPTFEWLPRNTPAIQAVDSLSKVHDPSDFQLNNRAFSLITSHRFPVSSPLPQRAVSLLRRPNWGVPTVDVLASASNTRASSFFSKGFDAGAAAVDAYAQPWPLYHHGTRQLYWVFPGPVTDPFLAIRKLFEEHCDAILIVPSRSTQPWFGSLHQLPIVDSIPLGYRQGLYQPGPAVPIEWRTVPPRVPLTAHFISFLQP